MSPTRWSCSLTAWERPFLSWTWQVKSSRSPCPLVNPTSGYAFFCTHLCFVYSFWTCVCVHRIFPDFNSLFTFSFTHSVKLHTTGIFSIIEIVYVLRNRLHLTCFAMGCFWELHSWTEWNMVFKSKMILTKQIYIYFFPHSTIKNINFLGSVLGNYRTQVVQLQVICEFKKFFFIFYLSSVYRLSTFGNSGNAHYDYPKDSDMMELFQCTKTQTNR